jgi:parallel beta-helix repeat protein
MQSTTYATVSAARVSAPVRTAVLAAVLVCALPLVAHAGTRFVAHTGIDGSNCGLDAATACRSISQAIALAAPGDTIIVGPGRYGDLNRKDVLGDIPGEEIGSSGCSCVLSMNKAVIIISSGGAAVTIIDGTSVNVVQTVVVLSVGGEFGRPGKGFTVTETGRRNSSGEFDGHGIGIDAADVKVRGNQVIFSRRDTDRSLGEGIFTVNSAAIRIEGNHVLNWRVGIDIRVAGTATVSKNQVIGNDAGILAQGGTVVGNVATGNEHGIEVSQDTTVSGNAALRNGLGFVVFKPFIGVLTKNNMFGNAACGLANVGEVGLNAANNYWGVATGPGAPPADQVCNSGGSTTTSPFATTPFKVQILKP